MFGYSEILIWSIVAKSRFGLSRCAADACACLNGGALEAPDWRGLRKNRFYITMRPSLGEACMERSISIHNCSFCEIRFWQGFPGKNRFKSHGEIRVHRQR